MDVLEKNLIIFKYILPDRFGRYVSSLTTPWYNLVIFGKLDLRQLWAVCFFFEVFILFFIYVNYSDGTFSVWVWFPFLI